MLGTVRSGEELGVEEVHLSLYKGGNRKRNVKKETYLKSVIGRHEAKTHSHWGYF